VPEGQEKALNEPVIELENGHALLARPGAFRVLSPPEEAAYLALEEQLRTLCVGATVTLAQAGVGPGNALAVISTALRSQLRALGAGAPSTAAASGGAPPDGDPGG
jgi:hypothetical protein